ncbi:MAG: carbohydrate porin, partial [Azovibrio sp.]
GAWLQSGSKYRNNTAVAYLNDAQTQIAYSFTPQGAEKVAEIYYRYHLSPQFELSPNFQYVTNGGGNSDADSVKVFALRANIAY